MLIEALNQFLAWPWWGRIGTILGVLASIFAVASHAKSFFIGIPKDEEAAREIRHLLKSGPTRRNFSTYRKRLAKQSPAQIRVLLREAGAVETTSRITRAEMWGLPARG